MWISAILSSLFLYVNRKFVIRLSRKQGQQKKIKSFLKCKPFCSWWLLKELNEPQNVKIDYFWSTNEESFSSGLTILHIYYRRGSDHTWAINLKPSIVYFDWKKHESYQLFRVSSKNYSERGILLSATIL